MQIGKAGAPVSRICQAYPDRVEVRGRDLCGDLMGRLTLHRVLPPAAHRPRADRGAALLPRPAARRDRRARDDADQRRRPDDARGRPRLAAGRGRRRDPRRRAGRPRHLRGVRAAARGGAGRVAGGAGRGRPAASRARSTPPAARSRASAIRCTRPLDPRAERILELADERGVSGPHVLLARAFREAVAEAWGRPLTMNVAMPIAAVLLDLGFPRRRVKAVPILARTAGLLAHLAEEREQPLGFLMAGGAEEAIATSGRRLMLAPEVETRPWAEQLALDDALVSRAARLPARALGLLPATKLAGSARAGRRRARRHRARCRSPRSRAARDRHAREPDRRAPLRGAVRDRPHLLDERHDRRRRATSRSPPATSTTG